MERVVDFENMETSDATGVGSNVEPEVGIAVRWSDCGLIGSSCSALPEMTVFDDCTGSGDSGSIAVMGAALWSENGKNHIPAADDWFFLLFFSFSSMPSLVLCMVSYFSVNVRVQAAIQRKQVNVNFKLPAANFRDKKRPRKFRCCRCNINQKTKIVRCRLM